MGSYEVRVTDAVAGAPEDPTGFWVEHVRDNHGALHVRFAEPVGFRGGTVVQRAGEQQLVEFWSDAVESSARLPDAELRVYAVCGHLPNIEHAQRFVEDVLAFFARRYRKPE
ncbi:hypothetical protein [Amycolatopsis sp. NPDC051372]|uniref:alpha/beta fold hydrolase n=1 Tax=unclassified Amycolatopsis TaxID=2618356 RepID=UPI0034166BE7